MTPRGQILVSRTDDDTALPSVCTFKTSPCMPATRARAIRLEVLLQCSRRQVCMVHLITTDVLVPHVVEEILEVIKFMLLEQCQRMRFFSFDIVWEESCGLHAKNVCCPQPTSQEWSLRLNVPPHGETHQVLTNSKKLTD